MILLVVALVAVALPLLPTAPAGAAGPPVYVALGDSFAAGPLIPVQEEPWGCLKSTNNYAKHLAARLGYELRDATCSGARTRHMTQTQGVSPEEEFGREGNPPQFDRLDADVAVVTLQIGGNDIGFGGIAETCLRNGAAGKSCRSSYLVDGRDLIRERIAAAAPDVGNAIAGVAERSPEARILVLGYSGIFNIGETASCPNMLAGEEDAQYLRGIQEALNEMIAGQAALHGARYVDVYHPSAGHTACDAPAIRWVEPVVPVNAAAPVHPNLTGMLAVADLLEEALRSEADHAAALDCTSTPPDQPWVLLVHGTGVTPEENWSWGYQPDLAGRGFGVCTVELPDRALNDIQASADYVAHAIRTMFDASGQRIHVLGHSQGGLIPRWALRWNTDLRAMVDDVVTLGTPHQGTTTAERTVNGYTCEACHQMRTDSMFIEALSSWNETPGAQVSYTSIWTQFDEFVQPPSNANLGTRRPGAANFANHRVQDLGGFCSWRTVDHLGLAGDAVAHAFVLDALTNPGPAVRARVAARATTLCSQASFTSSPNQLTAAALAGLAALSANAAAGGSPLASGARYGTNEPRLASYVDHAALALAGPATAVATDTIELTALLTDVGGQPLAGRSVSFRLGGATATAVTGADGTAAARLVVDHDAGPASATARFDGDGRYRSAWAHHSLTVTHMATTMVYDGETAARGDVVRVAGILRSATGVGVAGKTITFHVADAQVTAVTDEQGRAEAIVEVPDHGREQAITASFAGDARLEPAATEAVVTWGKR